MKKFAFLGAIVGAAMFITNNASAIMGTLTISGTAQIQSGDFTSTKRSVAQKDVLFILAQATGDQSITNKPTKIFFDPDAFNTNLTAWINTFETNNSPIGTNAFGIFYYSNSVAGLVPLDGTHQDGAYYSYMEFDYNNPAGPLNGDSGPTGFWNQGGMEANSIININSSMTSVAVAGNAILYIHDNPNDFNLLGFWNLIDGFTPTGTPSQFYLANDALPGGFTQNYAIVLHGATAFKYSGSNNKQSNRVLHPQRLGRHGL